MNKDTRLPVALKCAHAGNVCTCIHFVCVCVRVCHCLCAHAKMHMCTYTLTYFHPPHTCTPTNTPTHTHSDKNTHAHSHFHMYTHTCTHYWQKYILLCNLTRSCAGPTCHCQLSLSTMALPYICVHWACLSASPTGWTLYHWRTEKVQRFHWHSNAWPPWLTLPAALQRASQWQSQCHCQCCTKFCMNDEDWKWIDQS